MEQFLDPWQVSVKIAFLNGSFWLAKSHTLAFLGSQRFSGSHADQIALQCSEERKNGHDNLRTHIVVGQINLLF